MKNFKTCIITVAFCIIAAQSICDAQITTLIYGDTTYMDRFIITSNSSYEDSVSFVLKPNLPEAEYIVISENRVDTLMLITDTLSSYFTNEGDLESQSLKFKGLFYCSIAYTMRNLGNINNKRIILNHPNSGNYKPSYWFDFDENWNLLSCSMPSESDIRFSFNIDGLESFGSYKGFLKDGAWLIIENGVAKRVELYHEGILVYKVSIPYTSN